MKSNGLFLVFLASSAPPAFSRNRYHLRSLAELCDITRSDNAPLLMNLLAKFRENIPRDCGSAMVGLQGQSMAMPHWRFPVGCKIERADEEGCSGDQASRSKPPHRAAGMHLALATFSLIPRFAIRETEHRRIYARLAITYVPDSRSCGSAFMKFAADTEPGLSPAAIMPMLGRRHKGEAMRTSKPGNSIHFEIGVRYEEATENIHIASNGVSDCHSSVRADAKSKRGHPNQIGKLAKLLRDRGSPAPQEAQHAIEGHTERQGERLPAAGRAN